MEVLRSTIISYYLKATYLVCISLLSWILSIPTCYIYRVKKWIITLGENCIQGQTDGPKYLATSLHDHASKAYNDSIY